MMVALYAFAAGIGRGEGVSLHRRRASMSVWMDKRLSMRASECVRQVDQQVRLLLMF